MPWTQVTNIRGPQGSTGAAGAPGAPGVGFTWRGVWSNSTAYAINDCVQRASQSYVCTIANTGNDPATDVTHWNLMAASGGVGNEDVGSIKAWPSVTPPASWLLGDGSAISRALYPDLFALIGTTYGAGDGATTFNLPDFRGRFILGQGLGAGLTNRALAATGGEEAHALSTAELASHTHGMDHNHTWPAQGSHSHSDSGHTHTYTHPNTSGGTWSGSGWTNATDTTGVGYANITAAATPAGYTNYASQTNAAWVNTGAAGSGAAHNNMPPFLVLVYVIKATPTGGPTAQAPLADTTQPGLLRTVSGKLTDFVDGTNNCQDLAGAITTLAPVVRSYNSIGNPTFEIDARTAGAGNAGSGFALDRWLCVVNGAGAGTFKQTAGQVIVAGTSFCVSGSFLRFNLTTQKATLAAGDYIYINQFAEGVRLRELLGGPTAAAIVCRSSVAPISFALLIRDTTSAYSLNKLCTISNPNAWTLITLPNIATWTASGNFPSGPGVSGYSLGVTLAAGANFIPPANDVWNAGNFIGAVGMSNFAAQAVGSTFDLGFVQHTPGGTAPGILDKEWQVNYDECQRYYCKNVPYGGAPCTGNWTTVGTLIYSNTSVRMFIVFPKKMAKTPTMRMCGTAAWAGTNQIYFDAAGANQNITSISVNDTRINNLVTGYTAGGVGINLAALADWDADTGW